jgi:predicted TIM-barrel fold metal-dependent hydrolase
VYPAEDILAFYYVELSMIIDFHTHIFPTEIRNRRDDFFEHEPDFKLLYSVPGSRLSGMEELIRNMDAQGVDKSVVFGFPWHNEEHFKRNNDYVKESVERYHNRLIGFCALYPLARGAGRELERCLKSGFSGVGELAFYAATVAEGTINALTPIAEIALAFDVPILIHTNEPVGHYYPGKAPVTLKTIFDLVQSFSGNKIILAHWGGGIFFYYLMNKGIKSALQNTWFDTAASPYLYDKEIYSISSQIVGPRKILFGSDYPLLTPSRYFQEMKEAGLPEEDIKKICGDNAASLLKIDPEEKG